MLFNLTKWLNKGSRVLLLWRLAVQHSLYFSAIIFLFSLPQTPPDECWNCHVGEWLDIPAQIAPADAIVVLGGDARQRLPIAVELFHAGIAPELWYTGAVEESQAGDGSAAQVAVEQAMAWGVPSESLTLLATTSTWTDGEEIAATISARDKRSIVVVTSWYHGRRALCAIHHHLSDKTVQVYYQPTATPDFGPHDWWDSEVGALTVTRELNKILFYWGYYGLVPWVC